MTTVNSLMAMRLATAPTARLEAEATGGVLAKALLFMAVTLTTFDIAPQTVSQKFSTDGQTLVRLAACAALGLYGCIHLRRTAGQMFRFPGAWATLFGLWAIVTVPFSASPMYAAAAVFTLACVILFAPAVLLQLGSRTTLKTILTGVLFFVGLNWFLYFTKRELALSLFEMPDGWEIYRFGNDAQQLGLQIAWALGFLLTLTLAAQRRWPMTLALIAVLVPTLFLTQSRTGIAASAAAAGIAIWLGISRRRRLWVVLVLSLGIVSAAFMSATGLVNVDADRLAAGISRSGKVEELQNFTGRDVIWEHAWQRTCERPILGWGYGCSRFPLQENPSWPFDFEANHAHNLWLNIALCMGLPGAALLFCMIAHQLVRLFSVSAPVPSIAVAIVIVASMTEPLLFGPMPRSHTVIWLIALFWQQMGAYTPTRAEDI